MEENKKTTIKIKKSQKPNCLRGRSTAGHPETQLVFFSGKVGTLESRGQTPMSDKIHSHRKHPFYAAVWYHPAGAVTSTTSTQVQLPHIGLLIRMSHRCVLSPAKPRLTRPPLVDKTSNARTTKKTPNIHNPTNSF